MMKLKKFSLGNTRIRLAAPMRSRSLVPNQGIMIAPRAEETTASPLRGVVMALSAVTALLGSRHRQRTGFLDIPLFDGSTNPEVFVQGHFMCCL